MTIQNESLSLMTIEDPTMNIPTIEVDDVRDTAEYADFGLELIEEPEIDPWCFSDESYSNHSPKTIHAAIA